MKTSGVSFGSVLLATATVIYPFHMMGGRLFVEEPYQETAPRQLIVKLHSGTSAEAVLVGLPGAKHRPLAGLRAYLIEASEGSTAADLAARIASNPLTIYVEPNRIRRAAGGLDADFGDARLRESWRMIPDGYLGRTSRSNRRAKIAVLDTGADCGSAGFQNPARTSTDARLGGAINWTVSKTFVPSEDPKCPWQDDNGHGTNVARLIVAPFRGDSGFPFELLIYKVLDKSGAGTDAVIAEAIAAAADAGAEVISLSFAAPGYSQILQDAIRYAWAKNCVVVAAAGNEATDTPQFPADANYVLGVAATDGNDKKVHSSSFGSHVDVAAPAIALVTNRPTAAIEPRTDALVGTSASTARVSALVGLLVLANPPSVANAAIVHRILESADSLAVNGGWEEHLGYGVIDAWRALTGNLRLASVGGIAGQVVDADGLPMSGVRLNVAGFELTTASTGLFRLRGLPAGSHALIATSSGRSSKELNINIIAGTDVDVQIVMAQGLAIYTGRVISSTSVAGTAVQALQDGLIRDTAIASSKGDFSLSVPLGIYDIRLSDASGMTAEFRGQQIAGDIVRDLPLPHAAKGRLGGMILDLANNPIRGAEVVVEGPSGKAVVVTDDRGSFSTIDLPTGTYTLRGAAPGRTERVVGGVSLHSDTNASVNMILAAAAGDSSLGKVATPPHDGTTQVRQPRLADLQVTSSGAARVIHVPAGGDLQAAIDQAQPGDDITLQPGAEYRGIFYLRNKPGSKYITIRTADLSKLPPPGKRISPAYAPFLPKIKTSDTTATIRTDPGAHHYRLVGLEISTQMYAYELIRLGSSTATTVSDQASEIELDRLYLHGDPKLGAKRGVTLNSASTIVHNCYFSDFKGKGQEAQALSGWNGPGPFDITNNYLEAAGENILFGGAAPTILNVVPSDIVIRRNHFYKQPSWSRYDPDFAGKEWTVKNVLELKMARRVTVEGNVIDYNWNQAQAGYAIVLTVRAVAGAAPWAVVEDVSIIRNIIRHSGSGVNVLGRDYNSNGQGILRRVLIKDNVFEDIDAAHWGGDGRLFQLLTAAEDVIIDHNTVVNSSPKMAMMLAGDPVVRMVYTNNITPHGPSGVFGSGKGTGLPALNFYGPGHKFLKNVLVGAPTKESVYPPNNFFPAGISDVRFVDYTAGNYRLANTSPFKNAGTDGQDVGADIDAVTAATQGVVDPDGAQAEAPSANSVTPSSGQGSRRTFRAVFSDSDGSADIKWARILLNSGASESGGCYISYEKNQLWLGSDDGASWLGPVGPGSSGDLVNSQCTVDASSSSVSRSGKALSLDVALSFSRTFRGTQNIYLCAEDHGGLGTGWQLRGTWTPSDDQPPTAEAVTPSSGEGRSQTFQIMFSDPAGGATISGAYFLINEGLSQAAACYVKYNPERRELLLKNDSGSGWQGPSVVGSSGVLSNQQCAVDVGASSATVSGKHLTVSLALRFSPSFYGVKGIHLMAEDGPSSSSGWRTLGAWTPGTNQVPAAVSVAPSSGGGEQQAFRLTYSDPNNASDLKLTHVLFGQGLSAVAACYLVYSPFDNSLSLKDDAGTNWLEPAALGVSGSLSNSQCSVDMGVSTGTSSGDRLTLTLALTFAPSFSGQKDIQLLAVDKGSLESGWQHYGVWTPAQNARPTVISVAPSSGVGTEQTFEFLYSDPNGFADLSTAYVLLNATASPVNGCLIAFRQADSSVWLLSNEGSAFVGSAVAGTRGTLKNSQCTLDVGAASASGSGERLTVSLPISFAGSFAGPKTVYSYAADKSGLSTGWQVVGRWQTGFTGREIPLPEGGDLQQAIDQAQPGDTVTLQPGATYTGNFVLRKKSGNSFISITTADPASLPAPGARMTPSTVGLPKIVSPNEMPAIATEDGAHHYRLVGLEVTVQPGVYNFEVVTLGSAKAAKQDDLASDIELDRLYIHGDPAVGGKRGVALQGIALSVRNCWISNFKSKTQEAQALASWNGPGPFAITNNYLEASGNGLIFGGATPKISGLVPSDIIVQRNLFSRPEAWKESGWVVRNLLDLKNARRVLVSGNVFENNWADADPLGFAISLTVRTQKGALPWAVVEDVYLIGNIIRRSAAGVTIQGRDTMPGAVEASTTNITRHVVVGHNLFYDVDRSRWGGDGRLFQVSNGPEDVIIDHNTCLQAQSNQQLLEFDGDPAVRFAFQNNIGQLGARGVTGPGRQTGSPSLDTYAPGHVFRRNALLGGLAADYPSNNFFPRDLTDVAFSDVLNGDYRLTDGSPFRERGTDGKDLGADIEVVKSLTQGVSGPVSE